MKYCSEVVSRKIAVLSTLATVAVVIIHSNSLEAVKAPSWAFWIGNALAFLQHWAEPFFFMVSGFFFDRAFCDKSIFADWLPFLRKKVRSLVVPYVLWGSVFGFLTMTPLKMYVNHQHGDAIFSGTVFAASSAWDVIDRTIGITGGNFVGALWYVRLLQIVFLTAPLWLGLRKISRWALLWAGLGLIFGFAAASGGGGDSDGEKIFGISVSLGGIGWILLGMAVSAFRLEEVRIPKAVVALSGIVWLVFSAFVIQNRLVDAAWNPCLREWFRIAPLFLIVVWWGGYDVFPHMLPEKLPEFFSWRFWVYCMHHPMTGWCGGIVYAIVGHGLVGRCVYQIVLAPIVLGVCLLAAYLVRRSMPKAFAILNGGR